MIVRLVTMTFDPERIQEFLGVFDQYKTQIRNAEGCLELNLIQDKKSPNIISTLSKWEDENNLETYRKSELFKTVWPVTKELFISKPAAITYQMIDEVQT